MCSINVRKIQQRSMAGFICIALISIFDVGKTSLCAVLTPVIHALPEAEWPIESEVGGKGSGRDFSGLTQSHPALRSKVALWDESCSKVAPKKKKTFCYPLHLFNMKQQYANFKTKLRISKHFCSILGCCYITLSSIKTKKVMSKDYASISGEHGLLVMGSCQCQNQSCKKI